MTRTILTPVTLPDARLSALLRLAQWAADRPGDAEFYDAPAVAAALAPNVAEHDARDAFDMIVADLVDATDFDTRGADAVIERLGHWDAIVGTTADEKASEMCDEQRADARFKAELLLTTSDKLANG
jgi:hypothetical protein